jgi:hypothetical protein
LIVDLFGVMMAYFEIIFIVFLFTIFVNFYTLDFIYFVYPCPAETLRGSNFLLVFLYFLLPFVLLRQK